MALDSSPSTSTPPEPDKAHRYLHDALRAEEPESTFKSGFWLAALAVGVLLVGFFMGAAATSRTTKPPLIGPITSEAGQSPGLFVYIVGQVHKPGVYEMGLDARVRDAIQKAGGPKPEADIHAINLAAPLEDGQKIEVPTQPKPETLAATLPQENLPVSETLADLPEYSPSSNASVLPDTASPSTRQATSAAGQSTAPRERAKPKAQQRDKPETRKAFPEIPRETTKSGEESQNADPKYFEKNPLNLNTATQEQLELLPGIGPAMAQRILEARKTKGGFQSVEELDEVRGIGEKTLEKLRPLVVVQ